MSVGTTPLTIHVPLSDPMKRRMTKAVATLETLRVMASSNILKGRCMTTLPSRTQRAEQSSSTIWLAPESVSVPKLRTVMTSSTTSRTNGAKDVMAPACWRS